MRAMAVAGVLLALFAAGCTLPNLDPGQTQAPATSSQTPQVVVSDIPTQTPTVTNTPSTEVVPSLTPTYTTTSSPTPEIPATITWATPELATIRPGAGLNNGLCTANFVFTDPQHKIAYIGTAAHCVDLCPPTQDPNCTTNGCASNNNPLPLGTQLTLTSASKPVTLVYSSWLTMAGNETDTDTCAYNDFALLRIDPADTASVSPSMSYYGGPTGLATASDVVIRHKALSYGASYIEQNQVSLHAKEGYFVRTGLSPWTTTAFLLPPSIPGDSGSPVLLSDGRALGDLVSGEVSPLRGASGVSSLNLELAYMHDKAGLEVELATAPLIQSGTLPETEPTLPSWIPSGYGP